MAQPTLYERLGGVFAIAAVVDHFSDALVKNVVAGETSENPQLRDWATNHLERLPSWDDVLFGSGPAARESS